MNEKKYIASLMSELKELMDMGELKIPSKDEDPNVVSAYIRKRNLALMDLAQGYSDNCNQMQPNLNPKTFDFIMETTPEEEQTINFEEEAKCFSNLWGLFRHFFEQGRFSLCD